MHSIIVALVAALIAGFALWYFTGAVVNTWQTRRKRRTYGQMVTFKPYGLRHSHRRPPKSRKGERH